MDLAVVKAVVLVVLALPQVLEQLSWEHHLVALADEERGLEEEEVGQL